MKTKNQKYKEMTSFWIKIFALTFAMGVSTGLVQVFAFGTNWARYSRFIGDVFGSALASEGIFAFFLESGFLAILLFGWNRVGPKFHYFSTICVALGAHFSAFWIVVANSWMQTPAGYQIEQTSVGPRAVITSFWEMVLNPSSLDRLWHVTLACWLTGVFFVLSVSAYYLLKQRHVEIARSMMRLSLGIGAVVLVLQLLSGDSSSRLVAKYQPSKFAAFEGIYKTQSRAPASVIGWVDAEKEEVHSIQIPGALSLMTYRDLNQPVAGLDQIPRDEWPNVPLVFQMFHLMVMTWGLMFAVVLLGVFYWKRKKLEKTKWLLWSMIFSVVLPHIGQQAGWIATETGRQPWIIWKLLRTEHGVSASINAGQVKASIVMFLAIYLLLFALFLFLLDRKIKHGPEAEEGDTIYRDTLKGIY